jgi:P2-related tail formation protein
MANERRILATGIADREHLAVFERMINERFAGIDTTKVMVYIVDRVDASALFSLAKQFDLLGYKGWKLATTEQERRDLVKRALELHRFKGTIFSIKEALKAVGFFDAEVMEAITILHNDVINYDGDYIYSEHWATFSVILDIGSSKGINEQQSIDIRALVNEYKNVRSRFIYLSFSATLQDSLTPTDTNITTVEHPFLADILPPYTYNGEILHGNKDVYGRGDDVLQVNIIPIP